MNNVEFGPKVKFDNFCDRIEVGLTYGAVMPFLGTIPAVIKVAFGTVQLITALAHGILTLPLRFFHDDLAAFNNHSWSHVGHGAGNIVCGLFEAIPLIGSLGCLFTILRLRLNNMQDNRTMPYDNVFKYRCDLEKKAQGAQ